MKVGSSTTRESLSGGKFLCWKIAPSKKKKKKAFPFEGTLLAT